MNRTRPILICCSLLAAVALPLSAAVTKDEVQKDFQALDASFKALEKKIENKIFLYNQNAMGDNAALLALFNDLEKNTVPPLTQQLSALAKKYGATPEAMKQTLAPFAAAIPPLYIDGTPPAELFQKVQEGLANLATARKNKAVALLREATTMQNTINAFPGQVQDDNFAKLKTLLDYAVQFDPANAEAKTRLEKADAQKKDALAAVDKVIDDAKWPAPLKDFAGPGNPGRLAEAARTFLAKEWGKENILAVNVAGNWVSTKKNIMDETIEWGLPINAAVCTDAERKQNTARVFRLTATTREERGVKQAPPFVAVMVGNVYKIRISHIRGGGCAGTGGGLCGRVFWLGLVAGNLLAGLLLAAPLLKAKLPQMAKVYGALTPVSGVIGVLTLIIALIGFLRNLLLHFAPLADLLPQLLAIVAGLLLGKELLLKMAAGTKAQGALAKQQQRLELLKKYQVPIGVACLVLALLHLVLGGAWLV